MRGYLTRLAAYFARGVMFGGTLFAAALFVCTLTDAAELRVVDFGAVGDGVTDDGPALRNVFAVASRADGPVTVVFERGKSYCIRPFAEFNGRLLLRDAARVTIEGQDAILLVHTPNRALGIYRSRDIVVRNLHIDYRPIPYVQGTITRIDNDRSTLEFEPHDGYEPPVEGDETLYRDGRNEDSVSFNAKTRKFYHGHVRISGVEAIGEGQYRVAYRGHRFTEAQVGDFFAMKHRWGQRGVFRNTEPGDTARKNELISTGDPSIAVVHSDRVLLESIRSLSAPGMTLNARGCSDLVVRGLRIERKGDRLVAGCSDGIHLKCNESPPMIEDCSIEGTMDDAIHIKISGDWITEVASPRRVKIRHMDIAWDGTNLAAGKRVMVYDHDRKRELATAEIVVYEPIDYRTGWVTLDQDVPEMSTGDSFYLEAEGEAVIRRCRFGTQLQRAILTHQPTLIQNCHIRDNGQGIVVSFVDIEGPPSQRIRVEDCSFVNLKYRAVSIVCPSKDYDQKGDPQFLCSGSTFDLLPGAAAFRVVNSKGISLTGNRYLYRHEKPAMEKYLILENSPLREASGNRYVGRP